MALLSSGEEQKPVSTGAVSGYLGVAPASVTEMLRKLSQEGFVALSPYHGAKLTSKGVREAQRVIRKHRLLERFLSDILHIPLERVHAQASGLEYSLSDEAEESLCRLLKHPDTCPDDGQVIPACDLSYDDCNHCMEAGEGGGLQSAGKRDGSLTPVSSLVPGSRGRVSFIRGHGESLRKLETGGVKPGAIVEAGPHLSSGRVEISVRGARLELGRDEAASVFVETGGRE